MFRNSTALFSLFILISGLASTNAEAGLFDRIAARRRERRGPTFATPMQAPPFRSSVTPQAPAPKPLPMQAPQNQKVELEPDPVPPPDNRPNANAHTSMLEVSMTRRAADTVAGAGAELVEQTTDEKPKEKEKKQPGFTDYVGNAKFVAGQLHFKTGEGSWNPAKNAYVAKFKEGDPEVKQFKNGQGGIVDYKAGDILFEVQGLGWYKARPDTENYASGGNLTPIFR